MKNQRLRCLLSGILFLLVLSAASVSAKADVRQEGIESKSIRIRWDAPLLEAGETLLGYEIWYGNDRGSAQKTSELGPSELSYKKTGIPSGRVRFFEVKAIIHQEIDGTDAFVSLGQLNDAVTKPGTPSGLQMICWYHSVRKAELKWTVIPGCSGYQYRVYNESNGKQILSRLDRGASRNYLTVSNVLDQNYYSFIVRAYTEFEGKRYFSPWSDKTYFLPQPKINTLRFTNGKIYLKWNKVNGASSYYVYASESPKKDYKRLKALNASVTSGYLTKVNGKPVVSNKNYYIYLMAVKRVGGTEYRSKATCFQSFQKGPSVVYFL